MTYFLQNQVFLASYFANVCSNGKFYTSKNCGIANEKLAFE